MNVILFVSANLLGVVLCHNLPCDLNFGVDISNGYVFGNGSIFKDEIVYEPENYVVKKGVKIGCVCNIRPCLRKCCPVGQFMFNKTCELSDVELEIPEVIGPAISNYYVVHGNQCPPNTRRTLLSSSLAGTLGEFSLLENGELFLPSDNEYQSQTHYCLDHIDNYDNIKALVCSSYKAVVSKINIIAMIISMFFLLMTFLVYIILPTTNLYGKCLICYTLTLFCAYLILVYIQLAPNYFDDSVCISLGIICYFIFMVSFFFMNVMAIDIWLTFGAFRGFSNNKKQSEHKRFIYYSVYAWGVPLLFVIVIISLTTTLNEASVDWYNPGLAAGQCWLAAGIPRLVYFYIPVACIITLNILLFGITAWKIKQVQRDTAVLRSEDSKKHESDKQKFNLYLKLVMAMGINWSLEIISGVLDWSIGGIPPAVWYLSDLCNAFYGVFIFFIFVFKKNIWIKLKNRCASIIGKPKLSGATTAVEYPPRLAVSQERKCENIKESVSSSL